MVGADFVVQWRHTVSEPKFNQVAMNFPHKCQLSDFPSYKKIFFPLLDFKMMIKSSCGRYIAVLVVTQQQPEKKQETMKCKNCNLCREDENC